jgi:ankyrin repeat protein
MARNTRLLLWALVIVGVAGLAAWSGLQLKAEREDPHYLFKAIRSGDESAEQRLLHAGLALTPCTNGQLRTYPIHVAAQCGRVRFLKELLSRGADPSQPDADGRTPIMYNVGTYDGPPAEDSDHVKTLDMLLEAGADINAHSDRGYTALHYAASYGSHHTAKLLLERGADLNAQNKQGQTPLHLAADTIVEMGLGTVELLLKAGADPSIPDNSGHLPIDVAQANGFQELARRLGEASGD